MPLGFGIIIPTYFAVVSLAVCLGIFWYQQRLAATDIDFKLGLDFALSVLLGGFVGARSLHVLYEDPYYYSLHPLDVFFFWQGGFVYLGGVSGAALSASLWARWQRLPVLVFADLATLPVSLAYTIGRLACFLNGCCYGSACTFGWCLVFPSVDDLPRHPTQIYASGLELMNLLFLLRWQRVSWIKQRSGRLFVSWLFLQATERVALESLRADDRGPQIAGVSLSTSLSLFIILIAIAYFLWQWKSDASHSSSIS